MKYISIRKLMNLIEREYRTWGDEYDALQLLGDLEDMPGEAVRPTETGKWVQDAHGFFSCNRCKYEWDESEYCTEYCPTCGAKMEVENETDGEA